MQSIKFRHPGESRDPAFSLRLRLRVKKKKVIHAKAQRREEKKVSLNPGFRRNNG